MPPLETPPPPEIPVWQYFTFGLFCRQRQHLAYEYFLTENFWRGGAVSTLPNPAKLEDHPLSAVRDCLFNLFAGYPSYQIRTAGKENSDTGCVVGILSVERMGAVCMSDVSWSDGGAPGQILRNSKSANSHRFIDRHLTVTAYIWAAPRYVDSGRYLGAGWGEKCACLTPRSWRLPGGDIFETSALGMITY
jgi:hypothetical protein